METGLSFSEIRELFSLKEADLRTMSPLGLAFLGDAVYTLVARSVVAGEKNMSPNAFHRRTSEIVNAKAQAEAYDGILPELTEEEKDVLRRGRNAHPATVAKHASVGDYRKATGLEALIGFLYMDGQTERMMELIKSCIKLKTD